MSDPVQFSVRPPMTVGQILNRVLRLLRANLKVFVGIAAVPPLVLFGMFGLVAVTAVFPMIGKLRQLSSSGEVLQLLLVLAPIVLVILALHWVVFALNVAAGAHAAVQADCGVRVTIGASYALAWRRVGRYVLLLLIIYAICFLPAILIQLTIFIPIGLAALNGTQPNPLLIVLFPIVSTLQTAALVAGVIFALRFSLAFPVSISENLEAVQALKRSGALTRGVKLTIFLVLLAIYAATYFAVLILMSGAAFVIVIGLFAFSGMHLDPSTLLFWILAVLGGVAFIAVMVLFMACSWAGYATALAVIYNDQRMRIDAPPPGLAPIGAPA